MTDLSEDPMPDPLHYLSLSIRNVRAFSGEQVLDLSKDGEPSRWCVIIGENGVGKTTLMQALAAMRPVPGFPPEETSKTSGSEASEPVLAEPVMTDYENDRILSLVRDGGDVDASLEATLAGPDGKPFTIGYKMATESQKLKLAAPERAKRKLNGKGPLVIGYSAFRLPGHGSLSDIESVDPSEALFDDKIGLFDANEIVNEVDYAVLDALREVEGEDKATRASKKKLAARWSLIQRKMTDAVAALIPNLKPENVTLTGKEGIKIRTPSGDFPLHRLSFGAQTTIAWVLDLAWRLAHKFNESDNPFEESAIVLIDEIELHLHPTWQRSLRKQLLDHFPKIQFIVTTHAPVTAQESVAAGDPISIVRWEGDHAVIVPDPFTKRAVRLDEVATELFELETSLPARLEELLRQRRDLIRKVELNEKEKVRLLALNEVAKAVRTGSVSTEAEVEQLMAAVPDLASS